MNLRMKNQIDTELQEKLKSIIPGKTYPRCVTITHKDDNTTDKFYLQSYFVGMYCALHINGASMPVQCGDYDNKRFVRGLIKDIKRCAANGAEIEIGDICEVKHDFN